MRLGQFVAENSANRAIGVDDRQLDFDRLALLQRRLGQVEELHVQRQVEAVILRLRAVGAHIGVWLLNRREDGAEIDAVSLPVINGLLHLQRVHPTNHFVDRTEAQLRHQLTRLLGHHEQVVHHVIG